MNNGQQHLVQEIFSNQHYLATKRRPLRGVRQDKGAAIGARAASPQPAPRKKFARAKALRGFVAHSQKPLAARRKAAKVTLWVPPEVKAELARLAEKEGLSLSATGAAFLEEALRQSLHVQHAVLLQPIIEQAIRKQMRAISTRLAWLLVRVAFDAGQTRSLVTNVLGRQPGVTPEVLKSILAGSGKTAKGNLTRRTPQITELIETVEQWMVEEDAEHEPKG